MLTRVLEFFQSSDSSTHTLSDSDLRVACAALLVEVAVIDNDFDPQELNALKTILTDECGVSASEVDQLVELARKESLEATSMYQFTRQVNDHLAYDQKYQLIRQMWRIAYADGNLDKYEEYIIRKVSDLIHLSHGEFIRAKQEARQTPASE